MNMSIIVERRNFVLMTLNNFTLSQRHGRVLMYQQPISLSGVDNVAAGAAAHNLASCRFTEMTGFSPPQTNFSLHRQ